MALAAALHLPEQRLHAALPRHPRELVDGRDHERRKQPVDLLVDHDDRQALAGAVAQRERALARRVGAAQQRPAARTVDGDGPRGRELAHRTTGTARAAPGTSRASTCGPWPAAATAVASSVLLGVDACPTHSPIRIGVAPQRRCSAVAPSP